MIRSSRVGQTRPFDTFGGCGGVVKQLLMELRGVLVGKSFIFPYHFKVAREIADHPLIEQAWVRYDFFRYSLNFIKIVRRSQFIRMDSSV